jgi:hypothetical protein
MNHASGYDLLVVLLSGNVEKTKTIRFEKLTISDWDNVFYQAANQGVAPFLYHRLKIFNSDLHVPPLIKKKLREAYLFALARNIRLFQELSQVLKVFKNNKIPVVMLKGIHVAKYVYSNIALRPMSDMDLLVRKDDLLKTSEKMLELHYHPKWVVNIEEQYHWHQHLPPFLKQNAFPIEIHWTLEKPNSNFIFDVAELWERARSVTLDGTESLVLSHEDLLLHLCFHTSWHGFRFGLRSLCDISETIRQYQDEINWEQVKYSAFNGKMVKYIYISLLLARELLEAPVPDEVLDMLMPDYLDPQIVELAKTLVNSYKDVIGQASPSSSVLADLLGKRTLKEKMEIIKTNIFPAQDILAQKYSVPLHSVRIYFYYLVRLKDILIKYSSSAWRLLFSKKELIDLTQCVNDQIKFKEWLTSP